MLNQLPKDGADESKATQATVWKDSLKRIEKASAALRRKELESATISKRIADQEKALAELKAKLDANAEDVAKARKEHDEAHAAHRQLRPPAQEPAGQAEPPPASQQGAAEQAGSDGSPAGAESVGERALLERRRRMAAEMKNLDEVLWKRLKVSEEVKKSMEDAERVQKEMDAAAEKAVDEMEL